MQISKHSQTWVSNLPSCKEYSRSKVTIHMPLKAVIFHRNVVQSPRRVHGAAAVGQARLRAGLVLLMLPGGLSSPGPTLSDAEQRAAEQVPPLLPALSSPYRDRLPSPHPPPSILVMRRDGEVSHTRDQTKSTSAFTRSG